MDGWMDGWDAQVHYLGVTSSKIKAGLARIRPQTLSAPRQTECISETSMGDSKLQLLEAQTPVPNNAHVDTISGDIA